MVNGRKTQRAARADPDLARPDPPALAHVLGADHSDRDDRGARLERESADAALRLAERARARTGALREDQDDVSARDDRLGGGDRVLVAGAALHRKGSQRVQDPPHPPLPEQVLLGEVVHRPPGHRPDHKRVEEAPVVGGDDHRTIGRNVLAADPRHPEVDVEERLEERAHDQIDEDVDPLLARACVKAIVIHRTLPYPGKARPLQLGHVPSAVYRTRALRGAVSGALAAVLWALEQPLDKALFASEYDDIEVLGRAVVADDDGWYPAGLAWHIGNGALFGAIYA